MAITSTAPASRVVIDDDLAERLRVVVDALGGADLPLRAVIRAVLVEAAEAFEARAFSPISFAGCRVTEDDDA